MASRSNAFPISSAIRFASRAPDLRAVRPRYCARAIVSRPLNKSCTRARALRDEQCRAALAALFESHLAGARSSPRLSKFIVSWNKNFAPALRALPKSSVNRESLQPLLRRGELAVKCKGFLFYWSIPPMLSREQTWTYLHPSLLYQIRICRSCLIRKPVKTLVMLLYCKRLIVRHIFAIDSTRLLGTCMRTL